MDLPERTVDSWLSAYLATKQRHARLWAPVERNPTAWDLVAGMNAVGGGAGNKVAIFENKGVYSNATGRYWLLRFNQHLKHLALDTALGGNLLYYVLPVPPWTGPVVVPPPPPPEAQWRTDMLGGGSGFGWWVTVVHVADLDAYLLAGAAAGALAWAPCGTDWRLRLYFGAGPLPFLSALPLRDFYSAMRACTRGRIPPLPALPPGWAPPAGANPGTWLGGGGGPAPAAGGGGAAPLGGGGVASGGNAGLPAPSGLASAAAPEESADAATTASPSITILSESLYRTRGTQSDAPADPPPSLIGLGEGAVWIPPSSSGSASSDPPVGPPVQPPVDDGDFDDRGGYSYLTITTLAV